MANLTRSVLSKVIAYAIDIGVRADNPFAGLKPYRLGTYHTWTDAEIAQFERRWPLGTRERLAFALLLYTGQRGGDVVKMLRSDIVDGRIRVAQDKARKGTINELLIPIHPALARALQAGPVVGMTHLITNSPGKPMQRLTKLLPRPRGPLACRRAAWRMDCARRLYVGLPRPARPRSRSPPSAGIGHWPKSSATPPEPIRLASHNRLSPSYRTMTWVTNRRLG
jgi:integrase